MRIKKPPPKRGLGTLSSSKRVLTNVSLEDITASIQDIVSKKKKPPKMWGVSFTACKALIKTVM
jgi:hypothetical protein